MKKFVLGVGLAIAVSAPAAPAAAETLENTYICIDYTYVWVAGQPVPTVRQVSVTNYAYCDTNIEIPTN